MDTNTNTWSKSKGGVALCSTLHITTIIKVKTIFCKIEKQRHRNLKLYILQLYIFSVTLHNPNYLAIVREKNIEAVTRDAKNITNKNAEHETASLQS